MIKNLWSPIDVAIMIYFRFFAGIFFAQELINAIVIGKLHEYTAPKFHFSYQFFTWLSPWDYWGMALHYGITIAAGFTLALGIYYRLSAIIVFLGYTLLFLMEMNEYINHTYLYCLMSFWMIFLPLDRRQTPKKVPAWMLYLILFHISLVYFYAGIAKINSDWLAGRPMNLFLSARDQHPLSSLYLSPHAPLIFSWGGLLFDLLIFPALIWKKTRIPALLAATVFHLSNVFMFGLATFPWFSLLLSTMFFNPSWPRKLPGFKKYLLPHQFSTRPFRVFPLSLLVCYIVFHLLLPFRHHLYPLDPSWSEEGHMFSWRMMLRNKEGGVIFWTINKTNKKVKAINTSAYLTPRQEQGMVGKPEHIIQFAHFIRDENLRRGEDVEVYASSVVSLNGRGAKEIIRQGVDLALEKRSLKHYSWILPLEDEISTKIGRRN